MDKQIDPEAWQRHLRLSKKCLVGDKNEVDQDEVTFKSSPLKNKNDHFELHKQIMRSTGPKHDNLQSRSTANDPNSFAFIRKIPDPK